MFISKRLMILVSIVVAIVMLAAGVGLVYAFSGWSQASATIANTDNANATATALATTHKTPRRVTGVVQALGTSSFTISTKKGKRTITVNVSASTKYIHNGQPAAFSDLQVGETVEVAGAINVAMSSVQATNILISPVAKGAGTPTPTPTPTP